MTDQIAISVTESTQIGQARRTAASVAQRANLNDVDSGKLAIIVTELATNLAKYAQKGEILLRAGVNLGPGAAVEVLSIDAGPGMLDSGHCLTDGFSTGGTAGNGLGAVQRLATAFDLYSAEPGGTVLYASVGQVADFPVAGTSDMQWGCVCLPAMGERVCGDVWCVSQYEGIARIMLADGLGHGPEAAAAAAVACEVFGQQPFADPRSLIESAHRAMTGTRGAAVAAALLNPATSSLQYAGVGNISGTLLSGTEGRGLFSHNGIVGSMIRKVQLFDYPWPGNGLLVMHSDGMQTRWKLDAYPGLVQRHPAVIAGVLYRDFRRSRDDITVLVGRLRTGVIR